jgi:hypothetical protein
MVLKAGRRPRRFDAVEEFAVDAVTFVWRARFPILGPLSLRVTDRYRPPDGLLEVRLLGLPMQRNSGPELAQGEAFRYLAEIPWVPHAIVTNRQLQWQEVDERTVEVSTDVAGERIALRLIFSGNEIVQTIAQRPRLEAGGVVTPWIGEFRDYRSFDGIRVPARGEVRWELPDGPFIYWRGTITSFQARE